MIDPNSPPPSPDMLASGGVPPMPAPPAPQDNPPPQISTLQLDPNLFAKAKADDRNADCKVGDVYKLTLTVKVKDPTTGAFDVVDTDGLIPDSSMPQDAADPEDAAEGDEPAPDENADDAAEEKVLGYKRPKPSAKPFPKVNAKDLQS